MIQFDAGSGARNGSPLACLAAGRPRHGMNLREKTRHTMPSNFPANSLKTNDGHPKEVTHKMTGKPSLPRRQDAPVFSSVGSWHAMPGDRPWLGRAIRRV